MINTLSLILYRRSNSKNDDIVILWLLTPSALCTIRKELMSRILSWLIWLICASSLMKQHSTQTGLTLVLQVCRSDTQEGIRTRHFLLISRFAAGWNSVPGIFLCPHLYWGCCAWDVGAKLFLGNETMVVWRGAVAAPMVHLGNATYWKRENRLTSWCTLPSWQCRLFIGSFVQH